MSLILTIIIGGLVGWAASKMLGRDEGIIMSIVIGIVGSFIGSMLSTFFTGADRAYLDFSWSGVLWSLVGSLILVAIVNVLTRPSHHAA